MWRFILITFAFLGWLFYELSGGADYKPQTQSIQARDKVADIRPVARPVQVNVIRVTAKGDVQSEPVTRSLTSLADLAISEGDRFEITLASVNGGTAVNIPTTAVQATEALQTVAIPIATVDPALINTVSTAPTGEAILQDAADIRKVTGTVVNMRSGPGTSYNRIGKLHRGDEVTVLRSPGNGWVKLRAHETGRVGWMSARLLSTASN